MFSGEIYEFANNSGTFSSSPSDFASAGVPQGLAFDSVGDMFLANQSHSGSIYEYPFRSGSLNSTPITFAQNVAGGYQIHDVAFQPVGPVPYWDGMYLSFDPTTFTPIPFDSGPAYSQNSDAIYVYSGPDGGGQVYKGDGFAYGLQSNLNPTPLVSMGYWRCIDEQ